MILQRPSILIIFLLTFSIFFFVYHLLLLCIPPLPWFDETFFASITASYNATGKFNLDIAPFAYNGEILLYGPVYFWITSFVTKIFGFSIFSFRLPGVIFGFLCLWAFYKILRLHLRKEISFLITVATAADPLFSSMMQSGRMELVALFFVLLSLYIYFKATVKLYKSSNLLLFAVSGTAFSVALLTTPRIGVILAALFIIQLIYLLKEWNKVKILQILAFGSTLTFTYLLWVYLAFGSITNFIAYYADFQGYLGTRFYFPLQEMHLYVITCISFITGLMVNFRKYLSELVILSLSSIIIFYMVVNDTGLYSSMITPLYYSVIGSTVSILYYDYNNRKGQFMKALRVSPLAAVLLINVSFFAIKLSTIFIASEKRNPAPINAFIKSYIPPNSKVIGDEMYYYSVYNSHSDFQYIHKFKSHLERKHYQSTVYNYDYLIWSDRLQKENPGLLKIYQKDTRLVKVADFKFNNYKYADIGKSGMSENIFSNLQMPLNISYNCTIYKRSK